MTGAQAAFSGGQSVADIPSFQAALPVSIVDLLAESGLCDSKSDARRQIKGGAIKIAGVKLSDLQAQLTTDDLDEEGAVLVSRGKKRKLRVMKN